MIGFAKKLILADYFGVSVDFFLDDDKGNV